ncbi:MAG: hypothetical protein AB8B83_05845 [Bdellovibrionales bacterium]
MFQLLSVRPAYFVFVTSLFVLSGCQISTLMDDGGVETSSSASVEASKSKSDDDISPLEQHMLARKDVDPKKVNRKNKFSKTVEDYEREEEMRRNEILSDTQDVRTLRIESDPLDKDESAKSYVERILAKYKSHQNSIDDSERLKTGDSAKAEKVIISENSGLDIFVTDVRIGQHPGKTRIVIDLSDVARFQTSLKEDNKILSVKLPSVSWAVNDAVNVNGGGLVRAYKAEDNTHGSSVEFVLGASSRIAYQKAFKPAEGRGNRIVLDLVSQ